MPFCLGIFGARDSSVCGFGVLGINTAATKTNRRIITIMISTNAKGSF
jgi:hypothetical protein